ncbi:MAG: MoaD/ThiS family protein [Gordonia paraffinivorans]
MAVLVAYGRAREIAGASATDLAGDTVADVIATARTRFGSEFDVVLAMSRIWLNGRPVSPEDATVPCSPDDELVILPPVAGG